MGRLAPRTLHGRPRWAARGTRQSQYTPSADALQPYKGEKGGEMEMPRYAVMFPFLSPLHRFTKLISTVIFLRWRGAGGEDYPLPVTAPRRPAGRRAGMPRRI